MQSTPAVAVRASMRLAICLALVGCHGGHGEYCTDNADCADGLTCWRHVIPHHCAPRCDVDNAFVCPDGFVCLGPRDLEPKECFQVCTWDMDCPEGWRCHEGQPSVCWR